MSFIQGPTLFIALLALALGATSPSASSQAVCAVEPIRASSDPSFLRSVKRACAGEAWTIALTRLFVLPPPPAPPLKLAPAVPREGAEQVTLEVDLFYNNLDPYPLPEALEKVNALLGRLEKTFEIQSVLVTGSVDHNERKTDLASEIASRRARKVEAYLRSAGISPTTGFKLAVSEPTHRDDEEGNARDRSARLRVTSLRAKVEQ
jgi:hypothetical protein